MTDEPKFKLEPDMDKPSLVPPEHVDPKAYFAEVASLRKPLQPLIKKIEILAEVRVGRVGGDDWFQVNPDPKMQMYGYVLKDKDKVYRYVHESMWTHPILMKRLKPVLLVEVTTFPPSGAIITPFHVPDPDRGIRAYETAWKGYLQAQSGIWTQLTWTEGAFHISAAEKNPNKPTWSGKDLATLLAVGFEGEDKFIISEDAPYVRQLRGVSD
jgi:hypothetical protein